jgi:hypothetical protein
VKDLDPKDATTFGYGDEQAEAVTAGDRAGRLTVLGTVVFLGLPPATPASDGYLIVAYQMSEPQVLAVAEEVLRARSQPSSLGGLTLASSGADSATGSAARTITIAADIELTLTVHAGDEGTFEGVVRDRVAGASFVKAATAASKAAVLVADATGGSRTILWRPTPGTVAELHGAATEAQILAVAAALKPLDEGSWLQEAPAPAGATSTTAP